MGTKALAVNTVRVRKSLINSKLKNNWQYYPFDVTLCSLATTPYRTLPLTSQHYKSPIGLLELSARAGRLIGVRFGAEREIHLAPAFGSPEDQAVLDLACEQLDEYFTGERQQFDVPIALLGTSFQTKVWSMLYRIPFGKMVSYQQIAEALDRGCARSVGTANGANPLPIFVPCHRVIASDGTLGGYAGGLEAKQALLDIEYAGAELFATAH